MPRFFISQYRRRTGPRAIIRHHPHFWRACISLFLFASLCFLYVWQITALSMRQYVKNDLLRDRAALAKRVQDAELAGLQYQSLARVEERLRELQLVRDAKAEHVTREEMRVVVSQR